jgi:hypothetical protein
MRRVALPLFLLVVSACIPDQDKVTDGLDTSDANDTGDTGDTGDTAPVDADGDGVPALFDCDDTNPDVKPGAEETAYNGLDDDCDESTPDDDLDGDGFIAADDCDDTNTDVNPGAGETAYNGRDDDCDESTTDDDLDGDGFIAADDCDDTDADVNPGAGETAYNGRDDDCDESSPDDDLDGDGFIAADDCDDGDGATRPDAEETAYNGLDDDCDPLTPDDDLDGDGAGLSEDCDDEDAGIGPDAEETAYNGLDDDCDPLTPDDDLDGDGFGLSDDCDDDTAEINPDAEERCDGLDNNCDGLTDDGAAAPATWYADLDLDGYGDGAVIVSACDAPTGYIETSGDCDDSEISINPGASEICNDGLDNDCDGGASGCGFSNVFPLADCDATIVGASDYDHLGYGLYAAGDLDGDALGDLVIGAVSFKPSLNDAFVYAVRGDVTGTYDVGTSSASTLLTLDSEQGKDALGAGVGIAGDLTGDGINDLIAGAPYYVDSVYKAIYMGSTYVVPGPLGASGLSGRADIQTVAATEINGLNGTYTSGGRLYAVHDYSGNSVDGSGDFNGDGVNDLVINSAWMVRPEDDAAAFVFYGPIDPGTLTVSNADAIITNPVVSISPYAILRVANIGDVNGDGQDDLGLGNFYDSGGGVQRGALYIFYGPLDPVNDTSTADVVITGGYDGELFGFVHGAQSGADLNDDGVGDLLVGSTGTHAAGELAGATYIFYGPLSGSLTTADADVTFPGEDAGDEAADLAAIGDVNNDGYQDVLIGADHYDGAGGTDSGGAFLFYGPLGSGTLPLLSADVIFHGEQPGDQAGFWLNGLGDANGDGVDDLAFSAAYAAAGGVERGAVYLCMGEGL